MKCSICKLEIKQGEKIAQCPNCLAIFHNDHYEEWLKNGSTCPVCKINDQQIVENISSKSDFSVGDLDEAQFRIMKQYTDLNLKGIPDNIFVKHSKSDSLFTHYFNKTTNLYIFKKPYYYAFGNTNNYYNFMFGILIIIPTLLLMGLVVPAIISPKITKYIGISLFSVQILLGIIYGIKHAISTNKLSTKWLVLEFQKKSIKLHSSIIENPYRYNIEIPIEDVVEFEICDTSRIWKENKDIIYGKRIIALTLRLKENLENNLGDVYLYPEIDSNENFDLEITLKDFYNLPITNNDEKYRKNVEQKKKWNILYIMISILLLISAIILISI
ncbi:MAG: RING finger domain-containing protein [Candidatus Thorarchaeota archaeon]